MCINKRLIYKLRKIEIKKNYFNYNNYNKFLICKMDMFNSCISLLRQIIYSANIFDKGLSSRMTNLVKSHNSDSVHSYKPFVISLNCKKILKYINKKTKVDNKIDFFIEYNKILIEICKNLYYEFDPTFIYTFNNEINLVYYYSENSNYRFNGNIHVSLTRMASAASLELYNKLSKSSLFANETLDNSHFSFDGVIVEFNKDYEAFNYIIWRQYDCLRNTFNMLYTCHHINTPDFTIRHVKLKDIEHEICRHYSIPNQIKYGILLKKKVYRIPNETDKYNPITRKKIVEISKDLTENFSQNVKKYLFEKELN